MQTLTPSAQEGTEGLQGVQEVAQDLPPLVDGPAAAKWVGVGSFIVIFLLVMILIIRGRVLLPAQRKAAIKSAVFEPAGDDAEITFDDDFEAPAQALSAPDGEELISEDMPATNDLTEDSDANAAEPALNAERPAEKPRRSPFAGLFSRKPSQEKSDIEETQEIGALDDGEEESAPALLAEEEARDSGSRSGGDTESSDSRQLTEEDEAARLIEARELEERRAEEEAHARAEQEAAFERRRNQAAIEQGLQTFAAMDDANHNVAAAPPAGTEEIIQQVSVAFEDRIGPFFDRLGVKIEAAAQAAAPQEAASDHAVISEAHFSEFAELLSEQIASLREAANVAIEGLGARIATLETAPSGAAALSSQIADLNRILGGALNTAPESLVGLGDIMGRALPPKSYALAHKLSNGKVAAALVSMPAGAAPIVVDDHFPVDAFAAYQRQRLGTGGGVTAENNFRSIVRRHIADAVVSFVIRGETGSHAFMLVPSEALFASLHADFADLVQESRNAGLWMMSPATLTATLQSLHAIMDGTQGNAGGGELLEEIIALRERVTSLEKDPTPGAPATSETGAPKAALWENGAPTEKPAAGDTAAHSDMATASTRPLSDRKRSLSPEEEAFERLEREETLADTGDKTRPEKGDRPPFPLR